MESQIAPSAPNNMPPKDNMARLLKAEEDRNRVINEARAKKQLKLKQAKADAERMVEAFKRTKDEEIARLVSQNSGGQESERALLVSQADQQIVHMRSVASERMPGVTRVLVDLICTVGATA